MDLDTIKAITGRTVVEYRVLRDGTVVRTRYLMPTTHVDICPPGGLPTYQGAMHHYVLNKGWPVQFANGTATGKTHRLSRDHYYQTGEAALEALVKHRSQRTPDQPWDDVADWARKVSNDMAVAAARIGELVTDREVFVVIPDSEFEQHLNGLEKRLDLRPGALRTARTWSDTDNDVLVGTRLDRQFDLDKAVAYAREHYLRYIETRQTPYDSGA